MSQGFTRYLGCGNVLRAEFGEHGDFTTVTVVQMVATARLLISSAKPFDSRCSDSLHVLSDVDEEMMW